MTALYTFLHMTQGDKIGKLHNFNLSMKNYGDTTQPDLSQFWTMDIL